MGNPLFILATKLRRVKKALIALNVNFGHLSTSVQSIRSDLHAIQHTIDSNPSSPGNPSLRVEERLLTRKLWTALNLEESLARQKSRVQWLSHDDKNSKFFFSSTKSRWNRNKIVSIENKDGCLVSGNSEIREVDVNYFKDLLRAPPPSNDLLPTMDSLNWDKTVSPDHALLLTRLVSTEEIYGTLKSMKQNKSPGPDGFNVNFFLNSWDIIGNDFVNAVKFFFSNRCML